ncbi:transposase [Nonomuraea sp. NPDC048882]|uniref:transposase n=1 Tax=Nonomuraea sp. NPDC048882 TaxID=3154347 RepID=UPI0033C1E624
MAGLICIKPRRRTRLIFRTLLQRGRSGEVEGFGPRQYAGLLDAALAQFRGAIVLVWDNDCRHLSKAMAACIQPRRSCPTVFQLPAYAPELNLVEQVWSALKRSLANLASPLPPA